MPLLVEFNMLGKLNFGSVMKFSLNVTILECSCQLWVEIVSVRLCSQSLGMTLLMPSCSVELL